jgi:ribonuclease Z
LLSSGLGFRRLEHILLTHSHLDHYFGLGGMLSTLAQWETLDRLRIYGGNAVLDRVEDLIFRIVFRGQKPPMKIELVAIKPGILLSADDFDVVAFPVRHRGPDCFGFLFQEHSRRPFLNERATELGVPNGPERRELVKGEPITLADGRVVQPDDVLGPLQRGCKLMMTGDCAETESLLKIARDADAIVTEATYLDVDAELARGYGHLTAGDAARFAAEAGAGQLILNHISGRNSEKDIADEARAIFPNAVVARDFDTFKIRGG